MSEKEKELLVKLSDYFVKKNCIAFAYAFATNIESASLLTCSCQLANAELNTELPARLINLTNADNDDKEIIATLAKYLSDNQSTGFNITAGMNPEQELTISCNLKEL